MKITDNSSGWLYQVLSIVFGLHSRVFSGIDRRVGPYLVTILLLLCRLVSGLQSDCRHAAPGAAELDWKKCFDTLLLILFPIANLKIISFWCDMSSSYLPPPSCSPPQYTHGNGLDACTAYTGRTVVLYAL